MLLLEFNLVAKNKNLFAYKNGVVSSASKS